MVGSVRLISLVANLRGNATRGRRIQLAELGPPTAAASPNLGALTAR